MVVIDADVAIDVLRDHRAAVAWMGSLTDEVVLPGFVAMEIIQGCRTKKEQRSIETRLLRFRRIWPTAAGCDAAFEMFARFHLSHSLGLLDSLIAQCAISLNLPLHTFNHKHYRVVPNLRTIQPYAR